MALQSFKCPNCTGELQMDDSMEKGFCMYCGSVIHVQEEITKIRIEHCGKIEIDDSKKIANSIELADRAYAIGNYEESYNYYCTALECDAYNAHATFRKGLCAALLSYSRANELEQAIEKALEIIRTNAIDTDTKIHAIFTDAMNYIQAIYAMECKRPKNFIYPSLAAVNNTFSIIFSLTKLCAQCADLITNEMIQEHPTFENDKKSCLEQGLNLCAEGMSAFKYIAYYQQVRKGAGYVKQEVYQNAKSPHLEKQKSYSSKMKTAFNTLPSTQKALMEYDGEIASLQKDVDAFHLKLEEYFGANPALGKAYKKSAKPYAIATAIVFAMIPFSIISLGGSSFAIPSILLLILLVCAAIGLGSFTIVQWITNTNARQAIIKDLPPDLTHLKNIHDESKRKLQTVNQAKSTFVKKNIKK